MQSIEEGVSPVESCIASCGTEDLIDQVEVRRTGIKTGARDSQSEEAFWEEAPGKNLQTPKQRENQRPIGLCF